MKKLMMRSYECCCGSVRNIMCIMKTILELKDADERVCIFFGLVKCVYCWRISANA